jgi:anti-sigma-K factor RskA
MPLEDGSRPVVAAPLSWRERFAMALRRSAPAWGMAGLAVLLLLAFSVGLLWARANQPPAPESATTLRTVALEAAPVAPGATGMLVISLDGEHGTLVVDALPVLPESQEYQLWLVKNEMRVSGGVFGVSKDGYGAVWVHAPDALASYETAGVTIEPAGGSPYPTGDRVLYGDLHSYPR